MSNTPENALLAISTCRRNNDVDPALSGQPSTLAAMATEAPDAVTMDKIVALCKRRGFLFQSSEIYGGLGSAYDYGHYGVLLKTNVKNEWWRAMIQERDDVVALDSAIILHPKTWEASGHLAGFSDPLVQCLGKCKKRWRLDHPPGAAGEHGEGPQTGRCPPGGGGPGRGPQEGARPAGRRRAERAARVQPDVPDQHRAGAGGRLDRLPTARD